MVLESRRATTDTCRTKSTTPNADYKSLRTCWTFSFSYRGVFVRVKDSFYSTHCGSGGMKWVRLTCVSPIWKLLCAWFSAYSRLPSSHKPARRVRVAVYLVLFTVSRTQCSDCGRHQLRDAASMATRTSWHQALVLGLGDSAIHCTDFQSSLVTLTMSHHMQSFICARVRAERENSMNGHAALFPLDKPATEYVNINFWEFLTLVI